VTSTTDDEDTHYQPLPPPTVFEGVWANFLALFASLVAAGLFLWLTWYVNSH